MHLTSIIMGRWMSVFVENQLVLCLTAHRPLLLHLAAYGEFHFHVCTSRPVLLYYVGPRTNHILLSRCAYIPAILTYASSSTLVKQQTIIITSKMINTLVIQPSLPILFCLLRATPLLIVSPNLQCRLVYPLFFFWKYIERTPPKLFSNKTYPKYL